MYEWIQQLNFGNTVETLLAIILGFGTLFAAIAVVRWIVSSIIDNEFGAKLTALALVVIGVPLLLHFESDYDVQPLMYVIIVIYSIVWLIKEAYYISYFNNDE
jgi:uncharacterized membrane protein YjdF